MRRLAVVVSIALLVAACSHETPRANTVKLADPGTCAPVDVAASPEIAPTVQSLADGFNGSAAARLGPDRCAFVRVQATESADAATRLVAAWPAPDVNGPGPALWATESSAWVNLANERLATRGRPSIVRTATSLGHTPVVVALPEPMAQALGWPAKQIGWRDLAQLAAQPGGWAAYGHPEWGAFRLGKANPTRSSAALLATIAVSGLGDAAVAQALESSVIYYGDASWPFLDNWFRLDKAHESLAYVSAVITDQRAVDAYNKGSSNGIPPKGDSGKAPNTPLVTIAPGGVDIESDYPLAPIDAPWVTAGARAGAQAFLAFTRTPDAQKTVVKNGFAAGGTTADLSAPTYGNVSATLDAWSTIRKRARVLLLFDVSDSMGDPFDPKDPKSPAKITKAKQALLAALAQLAPDDEVGLRVFTTDAGGVKGRTWNDIVKIGPLEQQRAELERAIAGLRTKRGSPLYAATRGAFDTMNLHRDPARINGVVLLTDGYNEYDKNNNRAALLDHLHDPVRVFTISYSPDADLASLRKIAQATNARVYDATDPKTINDMYSSALSNF